MPRRVRLATGVSGRIPGGFGVEEAEQSRAAWLEWRGRQVRDRKEQREPELSMVMSRGAYR